jgi:hypothetical protein
MGFADSPATVNALAGHGVRVAGYRWRWALGLKGGTYPPHRHQNGEFVTDAGDFEALPGEDVNGNNCACNLIPQYRGPDGRFAKPGLQPVFQAPVTAAGMYDGITVSRSQLEFDWSPLTAAIQELVNRPSEFAVTIPDGAIVINLPASAAPTVNVAPPEVNVAAPNVTVEAPNVTVEPPSVTVEAPNVTVEAPLVTVEPIIEIPKPAAPRMLPPAKPRETRIVREDGVIVGMEEVT